MLLFAAIAAFAVASGWAGRGPAWLRWLALLTGIAAGARAVEILSGGTLLEVSAPLAFIALVVAFSVLLLRRGRHAASRSGGR